MKAKQDWSVGSTVKVGSMALLVEAKVPAPTEAHADTFILSRGVEFFRFAPAGALMKITRERAKALVVVGTRIASERPAPIEVKESSGFEAEALMARYFVPGVA